MPDKQALPCQSSVKHGACRRTHEIAAPAKIGPSNFLCVELEVVADVLEDGGDLRAKQDQRANDDDSDERDDKRILDETLAAIAAEQTIQHDEVPLSQTIENQMYALPAFMLATPLTRHHHESHPIGVLDCAGNKRSGLA